MRLLMVCFCLLLQCTEFAKVGASVATTPCDVVEEADITFSCVADPQAAKEVSNFFFFALFIQTPTASRPFMNFRSPLTSDSRPVLIETLMVAVD